MHHSHNANFASYPDGTECSVNDLYGYCGGGACLLGSEAGPGSWLVGVVLFVVFYLVFVLAASWIYCRYTGEKFFYFTNVNHLNRKLINKLLKRTNVPLTNDLDD